MKVRLEDDKFKSFIRYVYADGRRIGMLTHGVDGWRASAGELRSFGDLPFMVALGHLVRAVTGSSLPSGFTIGTKEAGSFEVPVADQPLDGEAPPPPPEEVSPPPKPATEEIPQERNETPPARTPVIEIRTKEDPFALEL